MLAATAKNKGPARRAGGSVGIATRSRDGPRSVESGPPRGSCTYGRAGGPDGRLFLYRVYRGPSRWRSWNLKKNWMLPRLIVNAAERRGLNKRKHYVNVIVGQHLCETFCCATVNIQ